MTTERIRTEILEISNAIAVMLVERELPGQMVSTKPNVYDLSDDAKQRIAEHSDIIEEALWGLHQTIRAKYE